MAYTLSSASPTDLARSAVGELMTRIALILAVCLSSPAIADAKPKLTTATVTLQSLRARAAAAGKPLAVIVIKGFWCPACAPQLQALSKRAAEVKRSGGDVIALSTDDPGTNSMFADKLGLNLEIVGAPDGAVFEALGMWMPRQGHPLPGVVFLDPCSPKADRALRGRRPGRDQTDVILNTLKDMSKSSARCRTQI